MRRLQPTLVLVFVFAAFLGAAWLHERGAQPTYPPGSSDSAQPDGTRALELWLQSAGLRASSGSGQTADALFVVDPIVPLLPGAKAALDSLADRGATLVLAGGTELPVFQSWLDAVGISTKYGFRQDASRPLVVPMNTTLTLQAGDAMPLLTAPDGAWLALRKPYRQGTVIALASSLPITNQGLRDPNSAGFVYEQVVSRLPANGLVLFDESVHQPLGSNPATPSEVDLMLIYILHTTAGSVLLYAAVLVLLYVVLSGRHFGPALPPARPEASQRTMAEQVQAVASLYRRGHQFGSLRAHFARHYARLAARASGGGDLPAAASTALAALETASSERTLAAAVRQSEQILGGLPHAWYRSA